MMNRATMIITVSAWLLFMAVPLQMLHAAGLYVREGSNAAVREEPYGNSKMIGVAEVNDYLEIFETQGDWSRIKTPKGDEGWVLTRLLTKQLPRVLVINQLNEKVKALTQENMKLQEENAQYQRDNRERTFKMSGASREIEDIRKQYENLKLESTQYLDLKTRYATLDKQFKETSETMDKLSRENTRLKTSERLIFTLLGGGFIIIGLVIGSLLQLFRGKPKKGGYKL
jgi:SH3 domain protein